MIFTNCHLCGGELFPEYILQLKGMPKAAQYYPLKEDFGEDRGTTLNIYQCSSCGLVQLSAKTRGLF